MTSYSHESSYGPSNFDAFGKNIRQLLESPTIYESIAFGDMQVVWA
jgi:hypothetical protein